MQGLKELFNKQRVILILCLVILTAAIALFAVSSNSAESLSVFRYTDNNSAVKNISYTDNYGLGQAKLCIINVPYSETIPADSVSDKSDPHCSPLPDGTIDYYVDEKIIDNKEYVFLGSGKIIKKDECNVVDGFVLPENSISVASVNTENQTVLFLKLIGKYRLIQIFPINNTIPVILNVHIMLNLLMHRIWILLFTILTVLSENSILTAAK